MREPPPEAIAFLGHDVRQAVAVILASVSAVEVDPALSSDARRWLRHVADEARRITRIYEHAARDRKTHTERRSLQEVAIAVIDSIRVLVSTVIEFRPNGYDLDIDGTAVERALNSIIDNACRAAGPQGRVRITIEGRADGLAVVTVDDSGPGFGAAPPGRSGLGLLLTQHVLQPLGGSVRIAKHGPLGGARVELLLPAFTSQAPDPTSGAAA